MWAVYSGEVRGEVDTRSRLCYVGWAVWVQGLCCCVLCLGNMARCMASSCVCINYMYMYT